MRFPTLVGAALAGQAAARWLVTRRILGKSRRHVPGCAFRPDLERPSAHRPGDAVVVLLHGTFCDGRTLSLWQHVLEEAGFPVWIYEYPYLESIPRNAARLEQALEDRLRALGAAAPRRVMAVGYSQGGMIWRWLLAGGPRQGWRERVRALVQVASPNLGAEPSDLASLLWRAGTDDAAPALVQLQRRSRLVQVLRERPLDSEYGYGVIYGVGRGRAVLGRFFDGRPEGSALSRAVGRVYEAAFLSPHPNDGLVAVDSALGVLAEPGREGAPCVRVDTDHLGLLESPEAAKGLERMAADFLGAPAEAERRC